MEGIKISTLNIGSASAERARRIIDEWLVPIQSDIYVLTETSNGPGTKLIISEFRAAGWSVFTRETAGRDRGVLIASRLRAEESWGSYPDTDPAPGRCVVINVESDPQLQVIGMYVPNRGNDPTKTNRKREYLGTWLRQLANRSGRSNHIVLGDLNVVPPEQQPRFLPQMQFENDWFTRMSTKVGLYDAAERHSRVGHEPTWVAFTGEGYTYDHILPDESLRSSVVSFEYDHLTRAKDGITDHSALSLTVAGTAVPLTEDRPQSIPKQASLF